MTDQQKFERKQSIINIISIFCLICLMVIIVLFPEFVLYLTALSLLFLGGLASTVGCYMMIRAGVENLFDKVDNREE